MDELIRFATDTFAGNLTLVVVGLIGLYFGAEWLVKGSVDISLVLGISPLIIGLTVVAFGTSAPEMFAGIAFNHAGQQDAAIGNVVGSNICNIALMLGIAAVIRPLGVHGQLFKRDLPILVVASITFIYMLSDQNISRMEGGILFAGIIFYLILSFWSKGHDPVALAEVKEEVEETAHHVKPGPKLLVIAAIFVVFGIAVLSVSAKFLTIGAPPVARHFGVSEAMIGLTLIAIGTSLPEIATSVVASLRNQGDIITGNAIGSCIFNILAVVGLVALIKPIADIEGIETTDLAVMFGLLALSIPFLLTRKQLGRIEGIILLVLYVGYCALLTQR